MEFAALQLWPDDDDDDDSMPGPVLRNINETQSFRFWPIHCQFALSVLCTRGSTIDRLNQFICLYRLIAVQELNYNNQKINE